MSAAKLMCSRCGYELTAADKRAAQLARAERRVIAAAKRLKKMYSTAALSRLYVAVNRMERLEKAREEQP